MSAITEFLELDVIRHPGDWIGNYSPNSLNKNSQLQRASRQSGFSQIGLLIGIFMLCIANLEPFGFVVEQPAKSKVSLIPKLIFVQNHPVKIQEAGGLLLGHSSVSREGWVWEENLGLTRPRHSTFKRQYPGQIFVRRAERISGENKLFRHDPSLVLANDPSFGIADIYDSVLNTNAFHFVVNRNSEISYFQSWPIGRDQPFASNFSLSGGHVSTTLVRSESPNQKDQSNGSGNRTNQSYYGGCHGNDKLFFRGFNERYLGIQIVCVVLIGFGFAVAAAFGIFFGLEDLNRKRRILGWIMAVLFAFCGLNFYGWGFTGSVAAFWGFCQ